jgi:exosortase B
MYFIKSKILTTFLNEWWAVLLGLLILYLPVTYEFSNTVWKDPAQSHGPIVLIIVLYLVWKRRQHLHSVNYPQAPASLDHNSFNAQTTDYPNMLEKLLGGFFLVLGLLLYDVGRLQIIRIFEIGSLIPVLIGIVLITRGLSVLRFFLFPLFFMLFMLPLPAFFLEAVTLPMKQAVSYFVETILFWFDYPIAREGVILQIGPYKLLVADACAGMHTLISLEAVGLLYLEMIRHSSFARNLILALLIIPISFTANVIRVIIITLITFYYGDAAGQGFIHGFAGMFLFMIALLLIVFVDNLLQFVIKKLKLIGPPLT